VKRREAPFRRIDRSSPIPFYYQLQEILKEEIEHGRWRSGEVMPSEAELEGIFGVSRTVIRQALQIIESDGQVYRVKGKGTIVAEPKTSYEVIAAADSFRGGKRRMEPRLHQLVDSRRVTVGGRIGRLVNLAAGARVFELTFTHAVGGIPVSLSQMFLRTDASPLLDDLGQRPEGVPQLQPDGPDAYTQLSKRYGLTLATSETAVEAVAANSFESDALGVKPGAPVFLLSSLDRGSDGAPVGFTRTIARSDYFRFSVRITRSDRASRGSRTVLPFLGGTFVDGVADRPVLSRRRARSASGAK